MSLPFHLPSVITSTREDGTKSTFIFQEKLGQGGFATVYRAKHQNTNKEYAMKVISKELLINAKGKSSLEKLKNEIQIQKSLNHLNIVQSKISFSDAFNYYIALEYCPGKTIREYLKNSPNGRLSEPETRKVLKDILNGLVYIHNRKIIHHDLKLENFIIGADGRVKIADFGLATFLKDDDDKKVSSICGTPNYMSPEMLLKKDCGNGFGVDIWAIGVAAFIMLTGKAPFIGAVKEAVYESIKNCIFNFPSHIQLSSEARDFIKSILKFDPNKRPSALDLLKHPFITKYDSEQIQLYNSIKSFQKVNKSSPYIQCYQKVQSPTKFISANNSDYDRKRSISSMVNDNSPKSGQMAHQFSPSSKLYGPRRRCPNMNSPIFLSRPTDDNESSSKKSILITQNAYENNDTNNLSISKLKKNFSIPNSFVAKHCFLKDDLCYLLGNGTVGICFNDKSRIVLDPSEEFAQYYKSYNSQLEVIDLDDSQDMNNDLDEKISLVKKFARAFKKYKNLYDISRKSTISSIPLHHISSYVKKDSTVLFKFCNKNLQVNFSDGKKLIFFWNTKKVCFTNNIKEKCILYDQSDITRMNANSDEQIKYKQTKEMLSALSRST